MSETSQIQVGVVTVGKNEGERFHRCLESICGRADPIVYVDSGSTDGSVELARDKSVEVVELNMSQRFTVARARNAGFKRIMELAPHLTFVMFVDGDAEVVEGWIDRSLELIQQDEKLAAVYGNRRERYPEASVYNRLSDMDWRGPPGDAQYCFGDMMTRANAIAEVGGYNETMMANEDPEIGIRLREAGYRILRVDEPMTIHDAAIHRFWQWWKRTIRSGHGFAEGAQLYGRGRDAHWVKEVRSNWLWGLLLPLVILGSAWPSVGWSLLGLLLYPVQAWRIARYRQGMVGDPAPHARLYGLYTLLGKFAMAYGQILYWVNRIRGRDTAIIHYKSPEPLAVNAGEA